MHMTASPPDNRSANADMLRHEIDSCRTGDKVPFPDPSAAPLGTDEEAGGAPASAAEIDQAMRHERGDSNRAPAVASGDPDPRGPGAGVDPAGRPVYSGDTARQGTIVLKSGLQRGLFMGGLVAAVLLAVVLLVLR